MNPTAPQEKFSIAAKKRLLEKELTVTQLAEHLGLARNTVSLAIHHAIFPAVRRKVAEFLDLEVLP